MNPGDVYVFNAPYNGGTHLPDVTVITPVFDDAGADHLFYVGSRGHHADIGGITPGSMPPDSHHGRGGRGADRQFPAGRPGQLPRGGAPYELLQSGPYPVRNVHQNVADLKAQIAAVREGRAGAAAHGRAFRPRRGARLHGPRAGQRRGTGAAGARRAQGRVVHHEPLDNRGEIKVAIRIDRAKRTADIDFTGTSARNCRDNFNAPSAVARAAVLYVFRTLVDDEIPMNDGCLKPLNLIIPDGSMLKPHYPAAVVAGNVETSQIITNTLFGALGVLASAQSTMNNITFGDDTYQYYETVAGGCGAGDGFDGTSAVQTHMTNSRLTDPEVLEWRFPVLVEDFHLREGSGGAGKWRGGDGTVRRLKFREPMTVAVLASRREVAPFGLEGGAPGAKGINWVERADGTIVEMTGTDKCEMRAGDVFVVATPGGGGFGPVEVA